MKTLIKIISLLLVITLSACDKELAESIDKSKSGLLYQIKSGGKLVAEYTYNDSNQILEDKSKWFYTKHNYQNGKLVSSDVYVDQRIFSSCSQIVQEAQNRKEWVNPTNTEKEGTKRYFHDANGKIIKSENLLGISKYIYDSKNRITRQSFYDDDKISGYIAYFYDNNDNLIKELKYYILSDGTEQLETTTEYEFDDKHNPYKSFNALCIPGEYTNSNNIIKKTYTLHFEVDSSVDKIQVTENRYTYNSKAYPISKNDELTFVYY